MNRRVAFSRELLAELPQWEASGWISPEQAALLRARYALPVQHRGQWWQMVLSLFAALCVGAGVIALFAANWASLSRPLRVVLSLTPLGEYGMARMQCAPGYAVGWCGDWPDRADVSCGRKSARVFARLAAADVAAGVCRAQLGGGVFRGVSGACVRFAWWS